MIHARRRLVIALLVTLLIQLSCARTTELPVYEDLSQRKEYIVLDFPVTSFEDILWREDDVIVAMQREMVRPLRQPYALLGDDMLRYLDLEGDSSCEHVKYRFPIQLSDGRLGLVKWCVTENAFTDASYIVAYDWSTGQLEQIVQNPLKHFDIAQCFSWTSDMTEGVQLVSNGLVGTLNWLTREGPEPVNITLRDGTREWNLADSYEGNGGIEGGTISCPDWSPKGDKIAVFVSFDAMGVEWLPRLDKPSKLVLIYPISGASEVVLSGVHYADPRWSPDGKKIAFLGYVENGLPDYQGNEPYGLWVFDIDRRTLQRIAADKYFKDAAWSPDSTRIAVIWCDQLICEKSEKREIREYKLPE